jgi:hypothetical protein
MHIKFQSSPMKSGNNSGSCGGLLNYLEKEDKNRDEEHELKGFFNAKESGLSNKEAKNEVEHDFYKKGLKSNADKFYTVTISFSQDELKGRSNKELTEFAQEKFGPMYCNSIKGREIDPDKLQWVAKLETERKHKGDDEKVKNGNAKSGESKEGDQRHIHFVVARKMNDGRSQVSPMSNHFRKGASTGAVKSGFDQDHIKFECEQEFDKRFNHERKEEEKVKNSLGDYRPDLVEKFNVKEIQKTEEKEQTAKDKFQSSQKDFEKTISKWDKVKDAFTKAFDKTKNFINSLTKKPSKEMDISDKAKNLTQSFDRKPSSKKDQDKTKDLTQSFDRKKPEEKGEDKDKGKDNSAGLSL